MEKKAEKETFTCTKCGKEKEKKEGKYIEVDGKAYCCDVCCNGDKDKGEGEKPKICEFC